MEIRSWYVYDSGEYEIDDTVKVWDGKDRSVHNKEETI